MLPIARRLDAGKRGERRKARSGGREFDRSLGGFVTGVGRRFSGGEGSVTWGGVKSQSFEGVELQSQFYVAPHVQQSCAGFPARWNGRNLR